MDSVKVDFGTEGGVVSVPWLQIRKIMNPGDFVEVTCGEYQGRTGWFDGTGSIPWDNNANIASVIEVMDLDNQETKVIDIQILSHLCSDLPQTFDVHVNSLKRIAAPFVLGTQQPRPQLIRSDPIPWLNTEIVITGRHAQKGYKGIITDVICNQQTSSGLRLQVQLTIYDPTAPFRRITLDYDDVVEARYVVFGLVQCGITLIL
jgi:hypothetical protein